MANTKVVTMPVATLKSGLRVANFSSPHPFAFEDGTVLAACDEARSRLASLDRSEVEVGRGKHHVDVALRFVMTDIVRQLLQEAEAEASEGNIDVVLVPFPVAEAFLRDKGRENLLGTPFRVCMVADRVSKKIHGDKFSVC